MAVITWKIEQLEKELSANGFSDVVKTVHWRCFGANGEFSSSKYGSIVLDPPSSNEHFIAFSSLTEHEVLTWIKAKLDANTIEASIETDIQNLQTPKIVTVTPPWETPPVMNINSNTTSNTAS